ncbi:MAG: aminotransferase class I/II-fold pyridoxal phosphate-dependent enzyme [Peptostreptococcus sp.]|uniref:aminotransferase class I/II-fold pyridoxal phosphate-dependent enzyme n=1 Tax=Peptostreptococcus sp. TaxID=1262 RepID=UPI002FCC18CC
METSIYNKLKEIKESETVSFHMPGHKYGTIFEKLGYENVMKELYRLDTTEIIGTDNLHNPKGVILQSQENVRKILFPEYDDVEVRYLVNGSTCGIQAAIMTACRPKDKIIINRACHQSVYNGCILADARPIFVNEKVNKENNIFLGAETSEYIDQIENNKDAKAVLITRPTYHGMSFEIVDIIKKAHEYNMIVIVDEAHGAHFGLSPKLPKSAIEYGADMVIQSVHKSLPAVTQCSILILNDNIIDKIYINESEKTIKYSIDGIKKSMENGKTKESKDKEIEKINKCEKEENSGENIKKEKDSDIDDIYLEINSKKNEYLEEKNDIDSHSYSLHAGFIDKNRLNRVLSMMESSSPSYFLMMSIEIAFDIYKLHGKKMMKDLLENINNFKKEVKSYDIFETSDPTKIFINTINKGINGYDFAKVLRYRYNIQVELANYSGILMLCTISNDKHDFDSMLLALEEICKKKLFGLNLDFFDDIDDATTKNKNDDIKRMTSSKQVKVDLPTSIPKAEIAPMEAFNMDTEDISIEDSLGRICGEFVIPYPPGVCLVAPGEVIESEVIEFIKCANKIDVDINGMESAEFNFIKVVKEQSK